MTTSLFQFTEDYINLEKGKLPPVHLWNPELSGDIDIRIDASGYWYHDGELIKREALVRVFSSILKREGDEYFLVTPVEKWRLKVEREAFQIVKYDWQTIEGQRSLVLTTNIGDSVIANADHPLRFGGEYPQILIRDSLFASLSRSVYYNLVEELEQAEEVYGIRSAGCFFAVEGQE